MGVYKDVAAIKNCFAVHQKIENRIIIWSCNSTTKYVLGGIISKKWNKASWWGWKSRVKKLEWDSAFEKQRLWHPVTSSHGK